MIGEPHRLQYLDAMGLTAWVARYRLPNARASAACDWAWPEAEAPAPPTQRLQALLDEADQVARARPAPEPAPDATPPAPARGRVHERLGVADEPSAAPATPVATGEASEPLRFALQLGCVGARWLVLLPGAQEPAPVERRLLGNLLRAAGIAAGHQLALQSFTWPVAEGLPVESPQAEAEAGLQALIDGSARRQDWRPERVLLFGHDAVLEALLAFDGQRCGLLNLPGERVPALGELAASAAAKRALWPRLVAWGTAWRADTAGEGAHGDA